MVKVERVLKDGVTTFYFETRDTSPSGLDELDEVYHLVFSSMPKFGGYMDSNRFSVEIEVEDVRDN